MSVRFRLATVADAARLQAIYAPFCNTPISFEFTAPTVEEMARRIEKTLPAYPWLACTEGAEILGYAYAGRHRERAAYQWSVDVSVYVASQHQRRGLGRALYTRLFEILKLQGYVNAYAGITLPNPASVGLHESVGFKPVGIYLRVGFKCGAWHDVAWYQRQLQPWPDEPQPPRPLSADAWIEQEETEVTEKD